ncbi:bifunctional lysylphosphatidylglycerol flippase/synthetase MprF [Zavarzinia compransoris]|uniref:Bifunctional lysylphosphatidylglycerol flippase/synthetase MprF n=1 Tax=Zavarzinia compransoris TaxID=1264899 RepID=A0A317E135_9PROT|nr:bifunctional lysylphosphatidylglycerol flippase/synthetase MprF [Zavarzinia compransoris]PWR19836.1 bifunctional lysylphosphatidylglycerol flippase/synthetase MprF [Zavarzinia compransoris]TDP45055.1 phosphatidylglycerol lysyltransferase [Zavarzinia compransoris]
MPANSSSAGGPRRATPGWLRFVGPLLALVVLGIAMFMLNRMAQEISIRDVRQAMLATPTLNILLSIGFTVVSFAALAAYDVLAVKSSVEEPVPFRTAAFAGAAGYAVSNALGFPVMTGGSVRYRLYSASGLNMADITRVVTMAWATFWLGAALVVGFFMVIEPGSVAGALGIGPVVANLIGLGLLGLVLAFVAWVSTGDRIVRIYGWTLSMPDRRTVTGQLAAGAIDMAAAGAALYVLLPEAVQPGIGTFAVVFAAALTLGIIAHTPGGIGVFEAAILSGLGVAATPEVVGSLILFRVIYYVLPLVVAAGALATAEIIRRRRRVRPGQAASRLVQAFVPPLAGGLVFLAGMILLISITVPHSAFRLDLMASFLPQSFVEGSHLVTAVIGVLLLVIARGLAARLAPAWNAAMVLLALGAVFSLLKGLDWEEAVLLGGFTLFLLVFHDAFYRAGRLSDLRPSFRWLALMVSFIALTIWLGFFIYRHVDYNSDLWWQFAWEGNASRFLRAMFFVALVVLFIAGDALINRHRRLPPAADKAVADEIAALAAGSPRANAALALLGDKHFLTTDARKAFIMYGVAGRSWIAMGDPVGDANDAAELVWRFRELADLNAGRVVFYAVTPDCLPLYIDLGLSLHKIGEVARVPLPGFTLEGSARQALRNIDRRAVKDGLDFAVVPAAEVPALIPEFRRVSDLWLEKRNAREKGFSLGNFSPDYLCRFDCAVIRKDGRVVAFANLWQSGGGEELSVDLMRYEAGVSRILMDALFLRVILYGRERGYRWFNLGAAPLSGLAEHPLAPVWNRVGAIIFRHGEKYYPFEGLRAFKEKFQPVWQPQYLACRGGATVLAPILVDVAALVAGGRLDIIRK